MSDPRCLLASVVLCIQVHLLLHPHDIWQLDSAALTTVDAAADGGGSKGANCVSQARHRSPALADTQHLLTTCSALNLCCPCPPAAAVSFSVGLLTTSGVTRCVVRLLRLGEYLHGQQKTAALMM
jgi:hypothetical protein